eukprot:442833-Amphidinium_carterae.1
MAKGFFFYWYGVIRVDGGKIEAPEFLKQAGATDRIIFVSTAPYPLGTLSNDFAKLRAQADAEAFTKGTVQDHMEPKRMKRRKKRGPRA